MTHCHRCYVMSRRFFWCWDGLRLCRPCVVELVNEATTEPTADDVVIVRGLDFPSPSVPSGDATTRREPLP